MKWQWSNVLTQLAGPLVGAGLGAYIAVVTITARLDATLTSIEEWRIPLLIQVMSVQTESLRKRIWRNENYINNIIGGQKTPYHEVISWDELIESTRIAEQENIKMIREFMQVVSESLHCDPLPGGMEK